MNVVDVRLYDSPNPVTSPASEKPRLLFALSYLVSCSGTEVEAFIYDVMMNTKGDSFMMNTSHCPNYSQVRLYSYTSRAYDFSVLIQKLEERYSRAQGSQGPCHYELPDMSGLLIIEHADEVAERWLKEHGFDKSLLVSRSYIIEKGASGEAVTIIAAVAPTLATLAANEIKSLYLAKYVPVSTDSINAVKSVVCSNAGMQYDKTIVTNVNCDERRVNVLSFTDGSKNINVRCNKRWGVISWSTQD